VGQSRSRFSVGTARVIWSILNTSQRVVTLLIVPTKTRPKVHILSSRPHPTFLFQSLLPKMWHHTGWVAGLYLLEGWKNRSR
jgi:hypothetical protein